jgi:tyrosinase
MFSSKLWLTGLLASLLPTSVLSTPVEKRGPDDELAATALTNAYKILNRTLKDGSKLPATCTNETAAIRKE